MYVHIYIYIYMYIYIYICIYTSPMHMRIQFHPYYNKILIESNPLKSRILVRRSSSCPPSPSSPSGALTIKMFFAITNDNYYVIYICVYIYIYIYREREGDIAIAMAIAIAIVLLLIIRQLASCRLLLSSSRPSSCAHIV